MPISPAELGQRVTGERVAKRLSSERLAAKAGLTTGTVSRIEGGRIKDPGYRVLNRVAVALGFKTADELLGRPILSAEDLEVPYVEEMRSPPFVAAERATVRRAAADAAVDTAAQERAASPGTHPSPGAGTLGRAPVAPARGPGHQKRSRDK